MTSLLGVFFSSAVCLGQGFEGTIEFSTEEKEAHRRNIDTILRVARTYLEDIWKEHLAFYRQHGVSKFYGDRNLSLDTRSERRTALRAAGAPISLVDQLQPTSCVGLTLHALETGFRAPQDERFGQRVGKNSCLCQSQRSGWLCATERAPEVGLENILLEPDSTG